MYQSEKCTSESEKDLALMGKLLYWCSGDVDTAIEVFKGSPYALVKDDKHTAKLERSVTVRKQYAASTEKWI